jgi:hypothetical protein
MIWRGDRWLAVEGAEQPLEDGDLVILGGNVFRFARDGRTSQEDTHGQVATSR